MDETGQPGGATPGINGNGRHHSEHTRQNGTWDSQEHMWSSAAAAVEPAFEPVVPVWRRPVQPPAPVDSPEPVEPPAGGAPGNSRYDLADVDVFPQAPDHTRMGAPSEDDVAAGYTATYSGEPQPPDQAPAGGPPYVMPERAPSSKQDIPRQPVRHRALYEDTPLRGTPSIGQPVWQAAPQPVPAEEQRAGYEMAPEYQPSAGYGPPAPGPGLEPVAEPDRPEPAGYEPQRHARRYEPEQVDPAEYESPWSQPTWNESPRYEGRRYQQPGAPSPVPAEPMPADSTPAEPMPADSMSAGSMPAKPVPAGSPAEGGSVQPFPAEPAPESRMALLPQPRPEPLPESHGGLPPADLAGPLLASSPPVPAGPGSPVSGPPSRPVRPVSGPPSRPVRPPAGQQSTGERLVGPAALAPQPPAEFGPPISSAPPVASAPPVSSAPPVPSAPPVSSAPPDGSADPMAPPRSAPAGPSVQSMPGVAAERESERAMPAPTPPFPASVAPTAASAAAVPTAPAPPAGPGPAPESTSHGVPEPALHPVPEPALHPAPEQPAPAILASRPSSAPPAASPVSPSRPPSAPLPRAVPVPPGLRPASAPLRAGPMQPFGSLSDRGPRPYLPDLDGEPSPEALPQRVPAEPDVPMVPEPEAEDPPAETPELARIWSHLRREDVPPRPEGFDVDAVLEAVQQVPGVREAKLRTNPDGGHNLRLELADGADAAQVSRKVTQLLQEQMGLSASPREVSATDPPRAGGAPSAAAPDTGRGRRRTQGRAESMARGRAHVEAPTSQPAPARKQAPTAAPAAFAATPSPAGHAERAVPAPGPLIPRGRPGPRVLIDQVQVSTYGLDATVEVRLTAGSRRAVGLSSGPAVDSYLLRLTADAAVKAINQMLRAEMGASEPRGQVYLEQAAVVPLGSCDIAVVVVYLACGGWVEQLAGSAMVTGDARQSVVRATLAAMNRRLEALLS